MLSNAAGTLALPAHIAASHRRSDIETQRLCFSSVYLWVPVCGVGICMHGCGACGGQKRPSDARELELQVAMGCLTVVVGNTLGSSPWVVNALTWKVTAIPTSDPDLRGIWLSQILHVSHSVFVFSCLVLFASFRFLNMSFRSICVWLAEFFLLVK